MIQKVSEITQKSVINMGILMYNSHMAYKYKFMRQIAQYIREGRISEDLDLEEVIAYYLKNKSVPKQHYKWNGKPRFYNRAMTANTRAKRNGDTHKLTHSDLEYIYERDGGVCKRCQTDKNIVFDHIKPYYRGGTNVVENLQLLCRLCNMEKGVA